MQSFLAGVGSEHPGFVAACLATSVIAFRSIGLIGEV
jgi:hypothetical protein